MQLSARTDLIGDTSVISFSGELDLSTLPKLSDVLTQATIEDHARIILDLDGITVLDDPALGLLLGFAARLRAKNTSLHIVCTNQNICSYLRRTKLDLIIPIATSVSEITNS